MPPRISNPWGVREGVCRGPGGIKRKEEGQGSLYKLLAQIDRSIMSERVAGDLTGPSWRAAPRGAGGSATKRGERGHSPWACWRDSHLDSKKEEAREKKRTDEGSSTLSPHYNFHVWSGKHGESRQEEKSHGEGIRMGQCFSTRGIAESETRKKEGLREPYTRRAKHSPSISENRIENI